MHGPFAWLDDRLVREDALLVPADDPGFAIADGLFETMRVRAGVVVALSDHLARLESSRLALALPPPPAPLHEAIAAVLAAAPSTPHDLALRLTLTARPSLIVRLRSLTPRDHERRRGLHLHTLPTPRGESFLARHKTLAWNANAVQRRLHPRGDDPDFEGLWLDPDGFVLEATTSNLFAAIGDEVITPPTSAAILPGISRARAIAALRDHGVACVERPITRVELDLADTLFATNAILPVATIHALDGAPKRQRPALERWPFLTGL